MSLLGIIEGLRRDLKSVVRASFVVLGLVVVADVVRVLTASGEHGEAGEHAEAAVEHASGFWASLYHIAETVPVFWTVFGFLGCAILVIVSKTYGHLGISKREDFYGE
jgi:hypothetical protein